MKRRFLEYGFDTRVEASPLSCAEFVMMGLFDVPEVPERGCTYSSYGIRAFVAWCHHNKYVETTTEHINNMAYRLVLTDEDAEPEFCVNGAWRTRASAQALSERDPRSRNYDHC